jgi:hypothetical protein
MVVGFCGLTLAFVAAATVLQRRTPAELIGRTVTASALANGLPQVVSIATGALLIQFVDYRVLQIILGVAVTAIALLLILSPWATRAATVGSVRDEGSVRGS